MTLVIGLLATDGLVIASDSQMSMGATSRPGQKVYLSDNKNFAFGLAGDVASMQLLQAALGSAEIGGEVEQVRKQLQAIAAATLVPQYNAVRAALGASVPVEQLPLTEAIVGVYCEGSPHLFHIDQRTLVTDLVDGFVSNGWGKPFADHAEATFRELRDGGLTLYQSEMLCLRVVEDAIDVSGPQVMLGGPIQIATVSLSERGPCAARRPDDDRVLQDAVNGWVRLEAERFRQHQPGG